MADTLYPYACGRCGKSHRTKALLVAHQATHPDASYAKVDACAKCGAGLTDGYCLPCHRVTRCGKRHR